MNEVYITEPVVRRDVFMPRSGLADGALGRGVRGAGGLSQPNPGRRAGAGLGAES